MKAFPGMKKDRKSHDHITAAERLNASRLAENGKSPENWCKATEKPTAKRQQGKKKFLNQRGITTNK